MNVSSHPFRLFVPVEFLSSSSGWIAGWILGDSTAVVAVLLPPLPLAVARRLLADSEKLTARSSSSLTQSTGMTDVLEEERDADAECEGDGSGDEHEAESVALAGGPATPGNTVGGRVEAPQRSRPLRNSMRGPRPGMCSAERKGSTEARVSPPLRILGWWRGRDNTDAPEASCSLSVTEPGEIASSEMSYRILEKHSLSEQNSNASEDTLRTDAGQTVSAETLKGKSPKVRFACAKEALWIDIATHPKTGLPVPSFSRLSHRRGSESGSACSLLSPPPGSECPSPDPQVSPSGLGNGSSFSACRGPSGASVLDRQRDWTAKPVQIFLLRLPRHHGFSSYDDPRDGPMSVVSSDSSAGCFVKTHQLIEALQRPLLWREVAGSPRKTQETSEQKSGSEAWRLSAPPTETHRQGGAACVPPQRGGGLRGEPGGAKKDAAAPSSLSDSEDDAPEVVSQLVSQQASVSRDGADEEPVRDEEVEATETAGEDARGADVLQKSQESLEVVLHHLQRTAMVVASVSRTLQSWRERERRSWVCARQQRRDGQQDEPACAGKESRGDQKSSIPFFASLSSPVAAFSPHVSLTLERPTRGGWGTVKKGLSSLAFFFVYFFFRFFEVLWLHLVLAVYPTADSRLARARRSHRPPREGGKKSEGTGAKALGSEAPQTFFWGTADHILSSLSSLAACAPLLRRCMDMRERDHAVPSDAHQQQTENSRVGRSASVPGNRRKPKNRSQGSCLSSEIECPDTTRLRESPSGELACCSCSEETSEDRLSERGAVERPQGSVHARKGSRTNSEGRETHPVLLKQSRGKTPEPSRCSRCDFFSSMSASEADRVLLLPSRACRVPQRLPWYLSVAPLRILGVVTAVGLDLLIGLFIPHLLALSVTGLVLPSSCRSCLPFSAFSPLAQTPPDSGRETCSASDLSALLLREFERGNADLHSPQLDPWESCLQPAWRSACPSFSFLHSLGGATAATRTGGMGGRRLADAVRADLSALPLCFSSAASCLLYGPPPSLFALFSRAYCFLHLRLLANHVRWLMDNPAGFKLNPNLGSILGSLILTTLHYWNEAASFLYDLCVDLYGSRGSLALPLALLLSIFSFLSVWLQVDSDRPLALLQKENCHRSSGDLDDDGCPGPLLRPVVNLVSCSAFHIGVEFVTLAFGAALTWRGPTRGWAWGGAFFFATAADLMLFSTAHVFYVYMVCAKLMETSWQSLCTLFTMFRGKKRNILRHRVDTLEFELDQLLMGCILFTIMSCLFPTFFLFYFSFAIIWLSILFVHSMLRLAALLVRRLPLSLLLLRLIYPGLFPGSISVRVLEDGSCTKPFGEEVADGEKQSRPGGASERGSRTASSTQVQTGKEESTCRGAALLNDGSEEGDSRSRPQVEDSLDSAFVSSGELTRHSLNSAQAKTHSTGTLIEKAGKQAVRYRVDPVVRFAGQNPITYIELQTHPVTWGEILLPTVKEALEQTFWPFSPSTLFPSLFSGKLIHFKKTTGKAE
ncbi:phosphatidylinositol n-acetylglucosaminyltransferase [Toxoplasma gondii TgCatPRC2]|uniref:Phosphatidylinositol n-acetylglucosaminyltransferase n=1 Tax=Toxoplasma gondii TgCatPRC2 TaxID=1130821 RepID=A0A151H1E2_TOXGO|nr:phosphatidylinositol n-acetylglucosaminyltransferase [Toxoplasma gondii TgCatPRC2]